MEKQARSARTLMANGSRPSSAPSSASAAQGRLRDIGPVSTVTLSSEAWCLCIALSQLSGESATGAQKVAFQLTDQFLNLMLDPFVNGRSSISDSGLAIGFAPNEKDNLPPDVALAYASIFKAPPKPAFDQRWATWGAACGRGDFANGDTAIGSNNIAAQTFGFAAGMDYHVSPTTVVGFALAGGGTNWGLANALGNGRSDAVQVGLTVSRGLGRLILRARSRLRTPGSPLADRH